MLLQAIMPHLPWYCTDSTVSIKKAFLMKFYGLNGWFVGYSCTCRCCASGATFAYAMDSFGPGA